MVTAASQKTYKRLSDDGATKSGEVTTRIRVTTEQQAENET
jgi:hypothetical protein